MKNLNPQLINAVREQLSHRNDVEEKWMFNGLTFMVNDKMCVCVLDTGLLCRVGPNHYAKALETDGCTPMRMGERTMRDFVFVDENIVQNKHDLSQWIALCLDFNPKAKASAKRKKT